MRSTALVICLCSCYRSQLKNQSPLDPVDPNQFVGQLVQFNTLDQIIGIRQLLQQFAGPATTTGSTQPAQGEQ